MRWELAREGKVLLWAVGLPGLMRELTKIWLTEGAEGLELVYRRVDPEYEDWRVVVARGREVLELWEQQQGLKEPVYGG